MNSHQFKNTTTRLTESLALIRCIDHQCKLRKYIFMAGIKRRSLDRKPIAYCLLLSDSFVKVQCVQPCRTVNDFCYSTRISDIQISPGY